MYDFQPSELILNSDHSIYHLGIPKAVLSKQIITVGDPKRIDLLARYFDKIHFDFQNREFRTMTAEISSNLISVISTGIGTDNIDIVINEVDALFNIDFESRKKTAETKQLQFFRLGTSGIVGNRFSPGDIVVSEQAYGFDALMRFYQTDVISFHETKGIPYYHVESDTSLFQDFLVFPSAKTMTMPGFYGPQNRTLRIPVHAQFKFQAIVKQLEIDNLEMETSGIYALSKALGHQAISVNALLANRNTGQFHPRPDQVVRKMIEKSLELIVEA
jgi:uridine phosphorylase